ncbi:MAG TPA: hypothetical protein VFE59_03570 [Trebonia sp.]|nr:hypothetical protein [Trebonia sp.]
MAAGALASSGVLRWTGGAAGSGLAGGAAADELSAAARAGPDIAAVQTRAGRPT